MNNQYNNIMYFGVQSKLSYALGMYVGRSFLWPRAAISGWISGRQHFCDSEFLVYGKSHLRVRDIKMYVHF